MPADRVPLVKSRALRAGSRVALVSPASAPLEEGDYARAERQLRELGFEVVWGEATATSRAGGVPPSHAGRARELVQAFADPEVDAIWSLRGGYGSLPLLSHLDWEVIGRCPKAFLGFSDLTFVNLALHQRLGLVTFHAPMPAAELDGYARAELMRVAGRAEPAGRVGRSPVSDPGLPAPPVTLRPGSATGPLLPGNLALITLLTGTELEPEFDGRILCVEELNEAPYRVHGLFSHLRLAGHLQRVAGIALGAFEERGTTPAERAAWLEVFRDVTADLDVPVLWGLPMGHLQTQTTLPTGIRARLDADAGVLELLETAVLPA